jgi:hypothetical protein
LRNTFFPQRGHASAMAADLAATMSDQVRLPNPTYRCFLD